MPRRLGRGPQAGPDPEAIRRVAERNQLPVDRITRVSVLDRYFYQ